MEGYYKDKFEKLLKLNAKWLRDNDIPITDKLFQLGKITSNTGFHLDNDVDGSFVIKKNQQWTPAPEISEHALDGENSGKPINTGIIQCLDESSRDERIDKMLDWFENYQANINHFLGDNAEFNHAKPRDILKSVDGGSEFNMEKETYDNLDLMRNRFNKKLDDIIEILDGRFDTSGYWGTDGLRNRIEKMKE